MVAQTILAPPAQDDENYRLSVLSSLDLLDTPPEADFDALVDLVRQTMGFPIALVSLVDDHRQWFKARCGLDACETSREVAFCAHAIHMDDVMVVPDATLDPRFSGNPLVTGNPNIRFYAGMQIRASAIEGAAQAAIGTLCVIDTKPRELSMAERNQLRKFAKLGEALVRGRRNVGDAIRYAEARRADAVQIKRQNRQLGQAERMAAIGSWRMAFPSLDMEWSDQVYTIHGLQPGKKPSLEEALEFFPANDLARINEVMERAILNGEPWDIEADFTDAQGVSKRVRSIGELERDEFDEPIGLVGVFQDITARHELELALTNLANMDDLTGLANRAAFNRTLDDQIAGAKAIKASFALILIDLDGFKPVNDTYGHNAGDLLLQAVAQRMRAVGDGWFAARQGGDEFAIIAPIFADDFTVKVVASKLLRVLREPFDIGEGQISISGTLGIAWFDPQLSRREFIHHADMALYDAKRAGRGIARIYGDTETVE